LVHAENKCACACSSLRLPAVPRPE
jgi:hypothetical protein